MGLVTVCKGVNHLSVYQPVRTSESLGVKCDVTVNRHTARCANVVNVV